MLFFLDRRQATRDVSSADGKPPVELAGSLGFIVCRGDLRLCGVVDAPPNEEILQAHSFVHFGEHADAARVD